MLVSLLGAFAGFAGGVLDPILMRVTDGFIAIPQLFVVIVVATIVVPSRSSLILLIGGLSWFTTARLVRGEALRIRRLEYVDAVSLGRAELEHDHETRTADAVGVIVVSTTFKSPTQSCCSRLLTSWGSESRHRQRNRGRMVTSGLNYLADGYWWLIMPVGVIIIVTVTSVNFMGDGLRDALEVRLKEQ